MTTEDLTRNGLGRTLFSMTWPMLFGVVSLLGFQLVDSAFIGQLGVEPLAALGFTLPMQQLIIGFQVGLGIATTAVISRTLGNGDAERARRLGGLVVISGSLAVALLCGLLWLVRAPVVTSIGADAELLPLISTFWVPWLLSAWCGAVLYFGYSVMRAHGDTRSPGLWMVVTSLINLVLDPLYIFVFGWGLPGAAWATVTAFTVGILAIYPALLRRRLFHFDLLSINPLPALRQIAGITGPAMVSQLMPPVSAMLATALVAGFGSSAVAAWGLGTRLEFFSIVVVLALTMSLPPMVGRFLGAGELHHVRTVVRIAVRFVLVWQLAIALLWLALSGVLSRLLTQDESVAATLQDYLLRVPLSYGALGVCMIMVSVCNALGLPLRALAISLVRLFLCYLPMLWLGAWMFGLTGVFTGALLGNLAAGTASWLLYRHGMRLLTREQEGLGRESGLRHDKAPSH
ncbi:MATE family efflux transporter [Aquisalimonas sp. 2447]|uniref:MATE family efflux transporter n=1 Tax=Aquisalimonas sp. 2447 TaxID=2740807 RepID=UPI001432663A|nr:MATE family efflux transporter [Aquisalimonas sp. 2447]QIT54679.1 MATE family efflux transporter [Aquisalimonas sp. 2447]